MRGFVLVVAAMVLASPAFAAGIDAHAYTCSGLQALVAANGFVFIGNPDFQDFVVANASYCGGAQRVQVRSVATADRPECLVNYCIPVTSKEGGERQ